jgi:hypothetical protein
MAEPARHERSRRRERRQPVIAEASFQGPASALASGQAGGEHVRREGDHVRSNRVRS